MGANNNNEDPANDIAVQKTEAEDKSAKKNLLLDTITKQCASSPHDILQRINHAVNISDDGSKLEATVLSGGYTNFSYKVYVDKHPELVVFAKLCFEYALWNPDRSALYDLQRTENEYEIMKSVSSKTPENVVAPLALVGIQHEGQNMKVLVTEWSQADEQFCNQFIDGSVDPRIASKIANTLATLHSIKDFDPNFNELVKPCMLNLLEQMKVAAREASISTDSKDRTEAYCARLGEDLIMKIIDGSIADYHHKDCLIHSDSHVFNILVEAKPSDIFEDFGQKGSVILCDWEMAMAGPIGRDIGLALSFPISCMVAHGLSGHSEANKSIELYINTLIDTYLNRMKEVGKTEEELASILKNIAGWCGWFMYLAFYLLNVQDTMFPVDTDESKKHVRDTNGILGLKLLRLAYDEDYAASTELEQTRKVFHSLFEEEVTLAQDVFAAGRRKMQPRRSSVLRATNRRLSDTEMLCLAAERMKRLSINESVSNLKRASIAENSAIVEQS